MSKGDTKRRRRDLAARAREALARSHAGAVALHMRGRDGRLTYAEGGRTASAYAEISGAPEYALLVRSADMSSWSDGEAISAADHDRIMAAFKCWAVRERVAVEW
jgi:hypothetical protein